VTGLVPPLVGFSPWTTWALSNPKSAPSQHFDLGLINWFGYFTSTSTRTSPVPETRDERAWRPGGAAVD